MRSTDLYNAASRNNFRQVRRHILNNMPLNQPDADGYTPLMLAALNSSLESAYLLLAAGADLQTRVDIDDLGQQCTALSLMLLRNSDTLFCYQCGLLFILHQAEIDLYRDGTLFFSQPKLYRLCQEIEQIRHYYLNHPQEVEKLLKQLPQPALPQANIPSFINH